jgi:hypothetical protein
MVYYRNLPTTQAAAIMDELGITAGDAAGAKGDAAGAKGGAASAKKGTEDIAVNVGDL